MKSRTKNFTRRDFIRISGVSGAALALGYYLPASGKEAEILNKFSADKSGIELNAWISIDQSGKVTITNHRAEMGQGAFQAVPQIIAEELEVDLNNVKIIFAEGNSARYGSQVTGGSSTVRGTYKKLLKLSASAREMLIRAAANRWRVDASSCYAENGTVYHKASGKNLGYGQLVEEASRLEVPQEVTLKQIKDYKILRKPLPRQDTPLKVNGKAIFGIDKKLPGMLYAVVERNPRFLGKVKSFDDSETKKVAGVRHVFKVEMNVFATKREGVAVVADNVWSAMQGRKALKVEWDDTGFDHPGTEELYAKMREQLKKGEIISYKTKGNVDGVFEKGETVEALYETPYESHSCMEPVNCTANVTGDTCEIWGPIQGPDWIREDLSKQLDIPKENVTVNMTFLGGGFGRKAFTDYPHEAALISKQIKAPVQVLWTREDDMTQGPFRPGMIYQCTGALNEEGGIEAFRTLMAGQNMDHQWAGANKLTYNSSVTEGLLEGYLDNLPHYSFGDSPLPSPIPVMWWRSVYSSTNGFAFESFMDELAIKAGKDPMDFRRAHAGGGRYQQLIDKLEEVSGWKSRNKNSGYGVAITECFASIVGEVVKVSKNENGKLRVDKVWAVMDCGWYVNPDIISAQVEGSIVMALGAATKHATKFEDGRAVQKNFNTYQMPRISDIPEIEVHVMDNEEKAGGVGEPGLPPFTPALTNAIFDLTGKRIRILPFALDDIA
jgi:isoquinoline 1-oxidoreductase beta subunit